MLYISVLVVQQIEYRGYFCKDFIILYLHYSLSGFQYLLLNCDYMAQRICNDLLWRLSPLG